MRDVLRVVGTGLRELVFPSACAGCDRAGTLLCLLCAPRRPPFVALSVAGVDVRAAASYEAGLRDALLAFKERGRTDLTAPLAALLGRAVGDVSAVLVPVPSTADAARRRGGDHVARLAKAVSRDTGLPLVPALTVRRELRDSAGLRPAERRVNLAGALTARAPRAPGSPAVLLDDIATTGATVAEAARALRRAGWDVAGAAVVAATPGPTPRRSTGGPLAGPRSSG